MMKTAALQTSFDYRDLTADDRGFVKARAEGIRDAAKKTAHNIVLIGQWLTEVKERLPYGKWYPWLETEFGWSDDTALNFMHVWECFKSRNYRDLPIDVSALYLIAAPKTPEPVREEVIRRAETGEQMTRAKAMEVLEDYKERAVSPSPAVARQIAIATGLPTAASSGVYVLPMSQEEEDAKDRELQRTRKIYDAMEVIANADMTPDEMVRLGDKHFCRNLTLWSEQAGHWLIEVTKEARRYEEQGEEASA